jgi:hypothetical protein
MPLDVVAVWVWDMWVSLVPAIAKGLSEG